MQNYWTLRTFSSKKVDVQIEKKYEEICKYVTEFLCDSHPYRDGNVCPFVPKAIEEDCLFFTYIPIGTTREECKSIINEAALFYANWKKTTQKFGAVIVFFIEDKRESWIKSLHNILAPEIMEKGFILGNLHPDSPSHSFYSASWFPLRSPHPLFLVRDMVPSDRRHLKEPEIQKDSLITRIVKTSAKILTKKYSQ